MYPKVAPDGKFLYVSCTECLVKMRASKLQTLEVSQRIGQGQRATLVSPDSQHVILMSGGGNSPIKGFPKIKYASYIYKISNLQIPVLAIKHGPYPAALGWDLVKKRIYAQRRGRQLMVFSEKGEKQAEFELGKQDMVLQLLVHPSGGKVCIWTEHNLYWIELAGL